MPVGRANRTSKLQAFIPLNLLGLLGARRPGYILRSVICNLSVECAPNAGTDESGMAKSPLGFV